VPFIVSVRKMRTSAVVLCGVVAAAMAVVVLAQTPQPCDAPHAFDCYAFQIDPTEDNAMSGHFSYDDANKRTAFIAEIFNGTSNYYIQHIHLYKLQKVFDIDLRSGACESRADPRPWHHFGTPPNATFLRQAEVGSSAANKEGVLVDLWVDDITPGARWLGAFTDKNCLPVTDSINNPQYGWTHTSFYDVTLGNSDPTVFDPPQSCFSSESHDQ